MGAQLARQAYAYAARTGLAGVPTRLLVFMALTGLDADREPRYFAAREQSAVALGYLVPDAPADNDPDAARIRGERDAAFQAVKRGMKALVEAGAIRHAKRGRVGQRAEYVLTLDLLATRPIRRTRGSESDPLVGSENDPLEGSESEPLSGQKLYPQGTTKEPQEERRPGQHRGPALTHVGYPQAERRGRLKVAS